MKLLSIAFTLLLGITTNNPIEPIKTTELTVIIENVKSDEGKVSVSLFSSEKDFLRKATRHETLNAQKGELKIVFENLPPGDYTLFAMHDKNGNGKLDRNSFGMPKEPYGLSKDGKNRFGPPNYEKSVFHLTEEKEEITIRVN